MAEKVKIDKIIPGGQGIGSLADGKKVFVWGVLPGEEVEIDIFRSKSKYAEANVVKILKPSKDRIAVNDPSYMATSPWQCMTLDLEQKIKLDHLKEHFIAEKLDVPIKEMVTDGKRTAYRNKMEYSFFGDDNGLHMALYNRGSHQKLIVEGSSLALPAVDVCARAVLAELKKKNIRAGDLKSMTIRCDQQGSCVAVVFTKLEKDPKITPPLDLSGFLVYHSNPRSPASLPTKLLSQEGTGILQDKLLGKKLSYNAIGFFQVNIPMFEKTLEDIISIIGDDPFIDMYAGVGSIGLSIGGAATLVEADPHCVVMAKHNAAGKARVIHASSEYALEHITSDITLVVDPPRSGLHINVIDRILENGPEKIIYLSCNPATQARDCRLLSETYNVASVKGYNFFPGTPHIESLAILKRI